MTLQEQMKENMKNAMKERNMAAVTTYRGLMSAMTNEVVASGKSPDTPVDDDMAMTVLTRESKKRKDSIQQYTDAGRPELAADEQAELVIIEQFLPEMMSQEDIKIFAEQKKADMGVKDPSEKGKFMGVLMAELKGKADGNDVKHVVDELFA